MDNRVATLTARHDALGRASSLIRCIVALASGHDAQKSEAAIIFQARWRKDPHLDLITRSAVGAGLTTDSAWAGGPGVAGAQLAAAFMDLVRPRSVLGRLPGGRRAPFNVRFPGADLALARRLGG